MAESNVPKTRIGILKAIFRDPVDRTTSRVFFGTLVISVISWCFNRAFLSYLIIPIINIYLILVLFIAAIRSDKTKGENWGSNLFPHRAAGLVIFLLIFLSVVFGFAAILKHEGNYYFSRTDAIYGSFISITSFSYNDFPNSTRSFKVLQMWESGTALLVFTGAFGLLISRISDFQSPPPNSGAEVKKQPEKAANQ